ncbi:uncharacterized protein V6R79_007203 [Siganus canaliculatus]
MFVKGLGGHMLWPEHPGAEEGLSWREADVVRGAEMLLSACRCSLQQPLLTQEDALLKSTFMQTQWNSSAASTTTTNKQTNNDNSKNTRAQAQLKNRESVLLRGFNESKQRINAAPEERSQNGPRWLKVSKNSKP